MNARAPLRTRLGRVRGLGSAKDGVAHWWAQRLTALALVPLTFWLVAALAALAGADHATVAGWLRQPVAAVLMVALLAAAFHHAQLGLQVVIEDYVHNEAAKLALIIVAKFGAILAALIGIFSVLRLSFGA